MVNNLGQLKNGRSVLVELPDYSLPGAEAILIRKVLQEKGWNLKQAAAELKIARGTLYSKMKRYGISRQSEPAEPAEPDVPHGAATASVGN